MKQYKVLANSITTHLGLVFLKNSIVDEIKFSPDHLPDLIKQKAIEETETDKNEQYETIQSNSGSGSGDTQP